MFCLLPRVSGSWIWKPVFGKVFCLSTTSLDSNHPHIPVLVYEVLEHLKPVGGKRYVDLTFGAGGHTRALLTASPNVHVFCLDRDPLAIKYAHELSGEFINRLHSVQGRFSDSLSLLNEIGCPPGSVDGIVMDLGASSMQMDSLIRGFGLCRDSPLDMRMTFDPHPPREGKMDSPENFTAGDVLNKLSAPQLARIFRVYGEERFARRIANAVVEYRSTLGPIRTTRQFADLVASVIGPLQYSQNKPAKDQEEDQVLNAHSATRVFQALRIFVNDELNELCAGLEAAHRLLRRGGRLAVISFHSLEDRLVKRAFNMAGCSTGHGLAMRLANMSTLTSQSPIEATALASQLTGGSTPSPSLWRQVAGPIRPTNKEIQENRRSRSAKLRIGEKISEHPIDGALSRRGDARPPQGMMTRSATTTEHTEVKPRNFGQDATTPGLTAFSKWNSTGSEGSIIPLSVGKCFLQLADLTLQSIEPNYRQSSTMVNPVKESDTELVQIDTRELSIELQNLTNDSSSIHKDIHNPLPEHSKISTMKRNKRKGRMAELIAKNRQNVPKSATRNRSPKHKLLLWRLARRQHRLIHAYPSLDSKYRNFNKRINTITSTSASRNRRWLVTGDAGPDSAVMIWDAQTRKVVRCFFGIYPEGVIALRLTPDARYLASLSAPLRKGSGQQTLSIWNWTSGPHEASNDEVCDESFERPQSMCSVPIKAEEVGIQTHIAFKEDNYFQLMSNSESHVVFYDWTLEGKVTSHTPALDPKIFQTNYGKFVMSAYIPNTDMAITVTSRGFAVVWEKCRYSDKNSQHSPYFRTAMKLIPLHRSGITNLTITTCAPAGVAIVTGDEEGNVRFFDSSFKLLHWYHDLKYGPVLSISFAESGRLESGVNDECVDEKALDGLDSKMSISIEDFIISTSNAIVVSLQTEGKNVKLLERDQSSTINSLATHPSRDLVTTVGHSGMIKTWNYKWLVPVRTRMIEDQQLNACAFDPLGVFLAVGCTSGRVLFVDGLTLDDIDQYSFDYAKGPVSKIVFSPDGIYCAYFDTDLTTTLLKQGDVKNKNESKWIFSGRHRAHGGRIVDIMFHNFGSIDKPRLLTLGEDRMLVEYDIENATSDGLPLKMRIQVETIAKPQCFTAMGDLYPENFICYANSDSKFRLLDVDSFGIRKTIAAPVRGAPLVCISTLLEKDDFPTPPSTPTIFGKSLKKNCIVFLTNEQLWMVLVPLDGDPYKTTSIIAHPCCRHGSGYASAMAVSRDRRFIFTSGGPDNSMHMWRADPGVLVSQTHVYCDPMQPFYEMLTEDQLNDLKDFFYLSLIRVEGVDSMDTRKTSYTIPITEIPYLTRAMGLFLSEFDIENMINEVKYSQYSTARALIDEIDLNTFIKLYVNYRLPYDSTTVEELEETFKTILESLEAKESANPENEISTQSINRNSFLELLQTSGEPISRKKLVESLSVLLGLDSMSGKFEDRCFLKELPDLKDIEEYLPPSINCNEFYSTVLGMDVCESDQPGTESDKRRMEHKNVLSDECCQTEI
nr:hypothetical transcript [Hymenolepis microstoma]